MGAAGAAGTGPGAAEGREGRGHVTHDVTAHRGKRAGRARRLSVKGGHAHLSCQSTDSHAPRMQYSAGPICQSMWRPRPLSCHLRIGRALACHSTHRLSLIRHSQSKASSLHVNQSAQATPPGLSRRPQDAAVTPKATPRPRPAEAPLMPIYVIGYKPRPRARSRTKPRPLRCQSSQATPPRRSFTAQAAPRPVLRLRSPRPLTAPRGPSRPRVPSGPARRRHWLYITASPLRPGRRTHSGSRRGAGGVSSAVRRTGGFLRLLLGVRLLGDTTTALG